MKHKNNKRITEVQRKVDQIRVLKRKSFIWEYEAVQRGKELERLLKIYMGWRRTGNLPSGFCEYSDKVWEIYLKRNVDNKHKRKGHENDSQIERLLALMPDAYDSLQETIDEGEI